MSDKQQNHTANNTDRLPSLLAIYDVVLLNYGARIVEDFNGVAKVDAVLP